MAGKEENFGKDGIVKWKSFGGNNSVTKVKFIENFQEDDDDLHLYINVNDILQLLNNEIRGANNEEIVKGIQIAQYVIIEACIRNTLSHFEDIADLIAYVFDDEKLEGDC